MKRTAIARGTSQLKRTAMNRGTKPMRAVSAKRRRYVRSDAHLEAYGAAEGFCVGHAQDAPGKCWGPLTPHHTLKRSVGGLELAEHYPVVTLCAWLNGAIESNPKVRAWALSSTFTRGGKSYPFLVNRHGVDNRLPNV